MLRVVPMSMLFLCCLHPSASRTQEGGPFLPGEYAIGHQVFEAIDADRNNRTVPAFVWYPADPSVSDGEPIHYERPFGWSQESPWIGGLMDAPLADAGPYPLVVLSHGDGSVPQNFEFLGEVLASHGYGEEKGTGVNGINIFINAYLPSSFFNCRRGFVIREYCLGRRDRWCVR